MATATNNWKKKFISFTMKYDQVPYYHSNFDVIANMALCMQAM